MDPLSLIALAVAAGLLQAVEEDRRGEETTGVLGLRRTPRTHTRSPRVFVEPYVIASEDPRDDDGIWHVTTALRAVLAEGLRSRRATGRVCLGGGPDGQAPDQISVVHRHAAAVRLYRAILLALRAARGEAPVVEIIRGVLEQDRDAIDIILSREDELAWQEELADGEGIYRDLAEILGEDESVTDLDLGDPEVSGRLDRRFPTGEQRYELIRNLEMAILDALDQAQAESEEKIPCVGIVGFTAPWRSFSRIDPRDVAILRLAADRRAVFDVIPDESELRFDPEDLVVIGIER